MAQSFQGTLGRMTVLVSVAAVAKCCKPGGLTTEVYTLEHQV